MKSLLVVVLVACDAGAPRPLPPAAPASEPAAESSPDVPPAVAPPMDRIPDGFDARPPFIVAAGRTYAVVRLRGDCGEATNLGGIHWRFEADRGSAPLQLHGGGHGIYGDDTTLPGRIESDAVWIGRYYVAEVSMFRSPKKFDGFDCARDAVYSGSVNAVAPATDLADATAQLARIPKRGFHPAVRIDRTEDQQPLRVESLDLGALPGR